MTESTEQPTQHPLLTPVQVGPYTLRNRMVMAPMTRNRAVEGLVPASFSATYYQQRASAGLIVTEGSQVSAQGVGYPNTPGVHSADQVEGWKRVTAAVHERGGRIFLQLWHVGRISHPSLQPEGGLPVAPSAIAAEGTVYTYTGPQPFVAPRALETAEIPGIVEQFAHGARTALESGFDGVEIHGANGYIVDQFLRDGTNHRTDEYGGSVENRARFLVEVVEAVAGVWGGNRVGVRVSPTGAFNSMSDSDPVATFSHAAGALDRFGLAYLHVVEPVSGPMAVPGAPAVAPAIRQRFHGPLILNGGFDLATADAAIAEGRADLISFGQLFLANPDLPERFAEGAPLNAPDYATFYTGGEKGYIDYPVRAAVSATV
ncbi:MAG TPA: alkene reductase [Thermoanaerobaculia bacterium]|jgi:N-ethylmaleimide reductase|nr:alkene reductase [Thermoanaerobaculia bacterium]